MADQAAATYHHGEMPVAAHTSTYMRVMGLFKWGALGVADLLLLLTLWFCTPAGLGAAVVIAVIVLALGVFALRSRKTAAH